MVETIVGLGCVLSPLLWLIWPLIAMFVAPSGRGGAAMVLGLLLGPIGVALTFFLEPSVRKMPLRERIRREEEERARVRADIEARERAQRGE